MSLWYPISCHSWSNLAFVFMGLTSETLQLFVKQTLAEPCPVHLQLEKLGCENRPGPWMPLRKAATN
jgi:hypothetical protein